ncbi:hypothetical protein IRY61_03725 [Candidatus Saccharibacteria bacterium]|nr:hypothetical protein [Candidatus Saccharibacteria bacterium]
MNEHREARAALQSASGQELARHQPCGCTLCVCEDEKLRKDAERYRWLRKGESDDVAVVRGLGAMAYGMSAVLYTYSEEIYGDDLDAAIDAAMLKEDKQ